MVKHKVLCAMENVVAISQTTTSDLYPEQGLNTQPLHGANYNIYTQCSACNLIPTPHWAYGVCSTETLRKPAKTNFFNGRSVGDFRMTGSDELVNMVGHYVPAAQLKRVTECDIRQPAAQRGTGWQNYNISSTCPN